MRKLIERCPGCGGEMAVHRMECQQCHTAVEGRFRPSAFDRLSPESLAFVELFVRRKGNMKEMERELAVAYSTVRHRLDEVVRELGPQQEPVADPPVAPARPPERADTDGARELRREVLATLERGEITPDEAIDLLGGR